MPLLPLKPSLSRRTPGGESIEDIAGSNWTSIVYENQFEFGRYATKRCGEFANRLAILVNRNNDANQLRLPCCHAVMPRKPSVNEILGCHCKIRAAFAISARQCAVSEGCAPA